MCALVCAGAGLVQPLPASSPRRKFKHADWEENRRTFVLLRCSAKKQKQDALGLVRAQAQAEVEELVGSCGLDAGARAGGPPKQGGLDIIRSARALDLSYRAASDERGDGNVESCVDWKSDERVRRSCEAGKALRVAVLVSGGVDSSVALRLLCDAGHSCTAYYLKIWFQEDFENFWSACPWEEDLSFAQSVCSEVGVELKVVHLTDEYWTKVVSESLAEIRAGRTPNPDMLCNSKIKFGDFLEHIKDCSFDRIASGHYARVERVPGSHNNNSEEQIAQLYLSPDKVKDQTYFLSQLSQQQMSRLMFPIGGLAKSEVRQVAEAMGLSNKHRKDSQGICFLGKVKFREFIERHLGEKEGLMLEAETGEVLGTHTGFWFYTIGQRQGLCLSNGPWFVVAKDVQNNVLFISRKYFSDKKRRSFRVGSVNWISGYPPSALTDMRCKVRHGPKMYGCSFQFDGFEEEAEPEESTSFSMNSRTAVVLLAEDDQGIAPGQYATFYQGDVCLGSGVILEALGDDQEVNVSATALAAAKTYRDPQVWKDSKHAKIRSASVLKGDEAERNRGRTTKSTSRSGDVADNTPPRSLCPLPEKVYPNSDTRNWTLSSILSKVMSWFKVS
ncbi:hypothetical protein Mapa_017664 [Marchantia paleacea]|nr:hypothetical protein Mapa_017664 [Marchantia paleacea]